MENAPNLAHASAPTPEAERFMGEYVRSLDERRFADWLSMFREDALYTIICYADQQKKNNLLVTGETTKQLEHRIKVGVTVDGDMRIHLLSAITGSAIDGDDQKLAIAANFAVLRDVSVTFMGQYHVRCERQEGQWKILRCDIVLGNSRVPELLYLPI